MDNKEEILEEIKSDEENNANDPSLAPDKKIEKVVDDVSLQIDDEKESVSNEEKTSVVSGNEEQKDTVEQLDEADSEGTNEEESLISKKKKAPIIIFLSILLVLDIAALVIYIIGIDKVLSFIK